MTLTPSENDLEQMRCWLLENDRPPPSGDAELIAKFIRAIITSSDGWVWVDCGLSVSRARPLQSPPLQSRANTDGLAAALRFAEEMASHWRGVDLRRASPEALTDLMCELDGGGYLGCIARLLRVPFLTRLIRQISTNERQNHVLTSMESDPHYQD
ncbi:hypothetical protein [Bradyrhizobium sp. CCBAU 53380]|uniref:hypothetical protein n=1 Tax=Bradyrhizobium sp. CCBAU 53380 TaxID=1325117 RepID=UPI0023045964|nr:hypothetical protein [Bradyrhizobium sp. CCBAU 53380]